MMLSLPLITPRDVCDYLENPCPHLGMAGCTTDISFYLLSLMNSGSESPNPTVFHPNTKQTEKRKETSAAMATIP